MTSEERRVWLYQELSKRNLLKDDDDNPMEFNDYEKFYNNQDQVKKLHGFVIRKLNITDSDGLPLTISKFYKEYVCDLSWAKKTTYCGGSGGGGTTTGLPEWAKCLESLTGISKRSDVVVLRLFSNGDKIFFSKSGNVQYIYKSGTKEPGKWRCNGTNGYLIDMDNGDKWDGTKWIDGSQNNGGGGGTNVSTRYRNCDNESKYTKGCKTSPDGDIGKVQACLGGLVQDGKFGNKTEEALKNAGYTNGFTKKDIDVICKTNNSGGSGNENSQSQVTPVVLPEWATCLKIAKNLKLGQDSKGTEIVIRSFGTDLGYFWSDFTFLYVSKEGGKVYGKWSCTNNSVVINTDDGQVWMPGSGWSNTPDKTETPDTNFNPTEVSGDEFSPSNQNESDMDNLENIINEVNSLIIEQTQQIVQAPKDELTILTTSPFLKDKGTLEALCRSNNGTSKPVNVNGRIYFAGKKSTRKGVQYYLTYDGMVLKREGDSCKFTYAPTDDGKSVMKMRGLRADELTLPYRDILMKFGIDPTNYDTDPYFLIDSISKDLKNLSDQGAVSSVFKSWNDMLTYYHSTDYNKFALVPLSGGSLNPPTNRGALSQYRVINGRNYGLNYNDKDVVIYVPATAAPVTAGGGKKQYDGETCKTALVEYLSAAIRYETNQDPSDNPTINNAQNRTFIKGCYGANMYEKVKVGETDLPTVNKESKIFKWFRGKTLSIKEVSYLLSGKDKNLPAGKNPYLPFPIRKKDMNESKTKLDNLIKENLQKLSEQKSSNLLAETKIIQTRTKILTENRILKFKQPREKFFNEIISEAIYLESQGFDKQIIKEEFWDSIKGLFGQHGSEAIFGTFKEYMGKWLLQKLTPVNPDGWIGSIIVAAIGNLHIDDLSKLTDCKFVTKKLASSIGEGVARKIQHDKGYDGGISDVVRNGLFSAIDNTEMVKSLESGLAKLVCPALSGVKTKLENKAKKMKEMAIQA
jgi:hypothetical protein